MNTLHRAAAALVLLGLASGPMLVASDHDDGENELKGRNLNLTDLYVFREGDQTGSSGDNDELILVMNTNPRSVARFQYYFSTFAHYEFQISRRSDPDAPVTGVPDVTLRFQFGPPDERNRQPITVTAVRDGQTLRADQTRDGKNLYTTPLGEPPPEETLNRISLGGAEMTVFAGLREDPFFFDVEQFFRVRAGALGLGPKVGFRPPEEAVDFTAGYNVNSIVVRVPVEFLTGSNGETTLDVWETICLPADVTIDTLLGDGATSTSASEMCRQLERLGRPAINEGLVVTNAFLNAFNRIPPSQDLSEAAAPVREEAARTIRAVDRLDGSNDLDTDAVAMAFLPDVMRIDTTKPSGYAAALNSRGSPVRGRLLLDDVIDITLTVLAGSAVSDGVSYEGVPGNEAQPGHQPLREEFPFLARPH